MSKLGLGRLKNWAGNVMSNDSQTSLSDQLQRDIEEMEARSTSMEKMNRAMQAYLKNLTKKIEADAKDKKTPVSALGQIMQVYGDDVRTNTDLSRRLTGFGQANIRIGSYLERFAADVKQSWQASVERSSAQLKDYQVARKTLEARRKEYDAVLSRAQKSKREDPVVGDDLRRKQAMFDESQRDITRRIQDIKDAEIENLQSLERFVDAEYAYHEDCTNTLRSFKEECLGNGRTMNSQRSDRSLPNTTRMEQHSYSPVEEEQDSGYGASTRMPIRQSTYDEPPPSRSPGYLHPDMRPPLPELPPKRPTYGSSVNSYDSELDHPVNTPRLATGPFLSATPVTPRQRSVSNLRAPESAQQYSVYEQNTIREQQAQLTGLRNRTSSMPLREGDPREQPVSYDSYASYDSYEPPASGLRPSTASGRKVPPLPPARAKKPAPPPPAKRSYSGYP